MFDGSLVSRQCLAPELVELGAKGTHPPGVELVYAAVADGPVHDQPRLLQHLQVLRDGGPADWQHAGKFAHRPRTVRQKLEDRASGRVAEGVPATSSVSLH